MTQLTSPSGAGFDRTTAVGELAVDLDAGRSSRVGVHGRDPHSLAVRAKRLTAGR